MKSFSAHVQESAARTRRFAVVASVIAVLVGTTPGNSVLSAAAGQVSQNQQLAGGAAQPNGITAEMLAQIEALEQDKANRIPVQRKVDSQLLYELKAWRGEPMAQGIWWLATNVQYRADSRVALEVRAAISDGLLTKLRNLGAEVVDVDAAHSNIQVLMDLDRIEVIASLPEVMFIGQKSEAITSRSDNAAGGGRDTNGARAQPRQVRSRLDRTRLAAAIQSAAGSQPFDASGVGSVTTEGDTTHGAATARATYHVDGTGVKIGVLSDGVTNLAASQARGDLGAVTVLSGQTGYGDEGTAMLEIVHDLAPGAQLYFATAISGITGFAQNIRALRAAGCDIIVDDVYYFVENPFQDGQAPSVFSPHNAGVVAQAVKDVTAAGALYFSSAGNSGNRDAGTSGTWEGDFVDGGSGVHNFGGGQTYDVLTSPGYLTQLFWADPLGGSANDYDLYVFRTGTVAPIAASTTSQTGFQDPYESVPPTLPGDLIVIRKYSGSGRFLHLGTIRGRLSIATAGEIHGHAAVSGDGAYGVAATPAVFPGPYPNPFNAGNSVE